MVCKTLPCGVTCIDEGRSKLNIAVRVKAAFARCEVVLYGLTNSQVYNLQYNTTALQNSTYLAIGAELLLGLRIMNHYSCHRGRQVLK